MSPAADVGTVCVTGMGMVSSLGHDLLNSCAAARAGLSRAAELSYFPIKSRETGQVIHIRGHQVSTGTFGFEGWARVLVLLKLAFEDLLDQCPLKELDPGRIGLYVALPDFQRVNRGWELIANEKTKENRKKRSDASPAPAITLPFQGICRTLMARHGLGIPDSNWFHHVRGHCGTATATLHAVNDLQARKIDHAVVGAADSLLEEPTLQWLANTDRLKMEGVATGLQPGEAGGFVVLERRETASARNARICAVIGGIHSADEEATLLSGKPALGRALGQCVAAALGGMKEISPPLWILVDQNGETYRSCEWGFTLTRLLSRFPALGQAVLWYTAMTFGDTAAASGLLAMCTAIRGFQRNYAPSGAALILSSTDEQTRTAIVLRSSFDAPLGVSDGRQG